MQQGSPRACTVCKDEGGFLLLEGSLSSDGGSYYSGRWLLVYSVLSLSFVALLYSLFLAMKILVDCLQKMVLLGSFLFSLVCSTLFAHFSLREIRLLTSYGRQK